ncbi:DUF6119 family protein [Crossiella sp. NPDC003009]
MRSNSFSVYLLKLGFDSSNSLKDENSLVDSCGANRLPDGAVIYVLDSTPRAPWWKYYFDLQVDLRQTSKGALIFFPVQGRVFALTFGHVAHNLRDESYEYDFGLKVTLNCVDPEKLRNADTVDLSSARKQRTQLSVEHDLTYFSFDQDSTVLRSITGKVRKEYEELVRSVTGASNLRVSSRATPEELVTLCGELLALYEDNSYLETFPGIHNIAPMRDPEVVVRLDQILLKSVVARSPDVHLSIPDIVNYRDSIWVQFSGVGASLLFPDVNILHYYSYLIDKGKSAADLSLADLRRHKLKLTNEAEVSVDEYSVYKSLIFDCVLPEDPAAYYLNEGNWYRVEPDYVTNLNERLNQFWSELDDILPDCSKHLESEYNEDAARGDDCVLLDKTTIHPKGQTKVEPCDVYVLRDGRAHLVHVKISTNSNQLSHLFNQGANSIELIKSEPASMQKLNALLQEKCPAGKGAEFCAPIDSQKLEVVFAIVTTKDPAGKSRNIPLFSRISLMRNARFLQYVMGVPVRFGFVKDISPGRMAKKKARKQADKKSNAAA